MPPTDFDPNADPVVEILRLAYRRGLVIQLAQTEQTDLDISQPSHDGLPAGQGIPKTSPEDRKGQAEDGG